MNHILSSDTTIRKSESYYSNLGGQLKEKDA